MKLRFGNFTCGSQLIEALSMMITAGLKRRLWIISTQFAVSPCQNRAAPKPSATL